MFEIQRATKAKSKITALLNGASGAGKSYSALLLARGILAELTEQGQPTKIGAIDTENYALSDYVDLYPDLDVINLEPPYTVDRYLGAFQTLVDNGYGIVIVDSLTHAWNGEGGILDLVNASTAKNDFARWKEPSAQWRKLLDRMILRSPVHVIATSRAKQGYDMRDGKPVKIGLQSELRDGAEYEARVSLMIGTNDHFATVSVGKDRSGTFDAPHQITEEDGRAWVRYFCSGAEPVPSVDTVRRELVAAMSRGWTQEQIVQLINRMGGDAKVETVPEDQRAHLISSVAQSPQ